MRISLEESASGVIGADGTCQVDVGPTILSHIWSANWATVSSDSNAPTLAFLTSPSGGNLGGTRSGNQDTTDLPGVSLAPGQRLTALWRLGTPGARCVLSVFGDLEIKER